MIPPAQELSLSTLVTPTERGIASRVLAKTPGGNVTLFAFDAGQGLEEHTSPFDALVVVLEGALRLTIGGVAVPATPGSIVRMRTRAGLGSGLEVILPGGLWTNVPVSEPFAAASAYDI